MLFTLYLAFGIWGVPAILVSQIESKGSELLGREVLVERASFNPFSLEAKLYGIEIGPKAGESGNLLEVGKLSANPQLSSVFGTITIKSAQVSDADLWVEVDSSGRFSFQDILDRQAAPADAAAPEETEMPAVIVKELLLANLNFHYKDSSLGTPYEETLTVDSFSGRDLGTVERSGISELDTGEAPLHWDFDGTLSTASGAKLAVAGGAESLSPWRFRIDTELLGFPLESVQPYVDESVVAQLAGRFGFKLRETVELAETGPEIKVTGEVGLEAFSVSDAEQSFARWESLRVSGIALDVGSRQLSIAEVAWVAPVFEGILLEDGSPRLPAMKSLASAEASPAEQPSAQAEPLDFAARIDSVALSRGQVFIEDRSLAAPFETDLRDIELTLSSLRAEQREGAYDASGALALAMGVLDGQLEMEAALKSLEGLAEFKLALKQAQLQHLQPYVAEHAHAVLEEGFLDLNLAGSVEALGKARLTGSLGLQRLKVSEASSQKDIATLSSLAVDGIVFDGESVEIESVTLVEPIVAAWQDDLGINLSRIAKIEEEVEKQTGALQESTGLSFALQRLELKSAGVGFVDTTLVSTHNSRVSDFDLVVEGVSTAPDRLADFKFSGVVDGSARIAGKGAVAIADPGKHLDFDMSFRGYDLTSTSPYWATYLGRKLAKGQFEIISSYEVRDNQLKGTNDFKIDQLTLGEKVESERAINLPLGFAIKLMQDPSGMIDYQGLPVSGDLADPQVKPWGLVGKAFRNLILNAVASPLKFLAKLAGGREDLDSIGFAVAEVSLDQDDLDKVETLRKFMVERPGLRLEASFLPNPAETKYLQEQYTSHLIINPEFQVISGLDLLKPVDPQALENAVRNRYATLVGAAAPAGETPPAEEIASKDPEPAKQEAEERKGLVKRLAGLVGLGKKETVAAAPAAASQNAEAKPQSEEKGEEAAAQAEVEAPSFDEMLAAVLESMSPVGVNENWADDLAEARIRNFKTALLAGETVEGSRVFTSELDEAEAKGQLGSIQIRLVE
ncbi:DUF748 domain-containing protein [Pelagicoccus sp. SDUM812005]|uniref:DUF748 domain-containing protein n=1 Tax=Pelagicoccus sp. SDUM812005 TaxID=3041257 RepID=UPI00280EE50C|nr:DUF748 domain-containing protein [Pelagicoccus sp. SDUM812005]MDQ8182478.1 DUF748 domain-containing protein [Pelagicoccus sp. SDUM812005]